MRLMVSCLCTALVVMACLALSGCAPPVYFAKATHGSVVDAETQQPIAGAVVVAKWTPWVVGTSGHGRTLYVAETATAADGHYVIPGWGPRLRPPQTFLDYRDPELFVFKQGYEARIFQNDTSRNSIVRFSEWDGKALPIKLFHGTSTLRLSQLITVSGECESEGLPLTLFYNELAKEAETLGADGQRLRREAYPCRGGH